MCSCKKHLVALLSVEGTTVETQNKIVLDFSQPEGFHYGCGFLVLLKKQILKSQIRNFPTCYHPLKWLEIYSKDGRVVCKRLFENLLFLSISSWQIWKMCQLVKCDTADHMLVFIEIKQRHYGSFLMSFFCQIKTGRLADL